MGLFSSTKKKQPTTTTPTSKPSTDTLKDPLQDPLTSIGKSVSGAFKAVASVPSMLADKWEKHKMDQGKAKLKGLSVEEVVRRYRSPFMKFAIQELSAENVECFEAIEGGASKRSIYNVYIKSGSPAEVNISGSNRLPLEDLASKGLFDQMDFSGVRKDVRLNLTDTYSRARFDKDFLLAVAKG